MTRPLDDPSRPRWRWLSVAIVVIVGCSAAETRTSTPTESSVVAGSEGIDLLAAVERSMPGVNILPGARADSVGVVLPNPYAGQFRGVINELGLPDDLFATMTQSYEEGVTHSVASECCIASWHWNGDDGLYFDLERATA